MDQGEEAPVLDQLAKSEVSDLPRDSTSSNEDSIKDIKDQEKAQDHSDDGDKKDGPATVKE